MAVRTSLAYALAAALWILFSDRALMALTPDQATVNALQTYKGWAFVAATATLLYLVLRAQLQRWQHEADARSAAEARLRESEERLRFALEVGHTGAWELDLSDHGVSCSPQHDLIFGYASTDPQWSLEKFLEHVLPPDRAAVEAGLRDAFNNRSPLHFECRIRRADGEVRWIRAAGGHRRDAAAAQPRMAGIVQDITERKRVEEQLTALTTTLEQRVNERTAELARARDAAEAASRAKSQFLANMSHELRTPLNAIMGPAQLLSMNSQGNLSPRQVKLASMIHGSGAELLQLIGNLLDLARIEAGRLPVELETMRLDWLCDRIEHSMALPAQKKRLALSIETEAGLPRSFRTDPVRLQQVLRNLIANAIKFTAHGKVTLHISRVGQSQDSACPAPAHAGEALAFAVSDTGIGIAPEKQQVIFEAFEQADTGITRRYGGTGLGLSISREIAQLLGGELTLHSELGVGSTFTLYLPLREAGTAAGTALHMDADCGAADADSPVSAARVRLCAQQAAPSLAGHEVLLVDDDGHNIAAMTAVLESHGLVVIKATSAREALARLQQHPTIAAALMDIMMPEIDGYEATRRLHGMPGFEALPVIALTARAMPGEREACLAAGCCDYLAKPVDAHRLVQVLGTWMQR